MLSFYNMWTVARFEMKTLLRSWFFRIFTGLSVSILIFLNIGMFTNVGNAYWLFRGIPASIPYLNIMLMNVIQAIIGVFLASDFLKRDKKLDTTEVVYMRSMTNGDYVLGKLMGILMIFIALNVLVLLIAGIFNFFFADVPVNLAAYLYYPLLISIPTLVFIFGLSFLFMVVIRNQAVTFIVLLGYIGVTLFFLSRQWHFLFDYMAFNLPLMYSDFVGFGNLGEILLHRGIYLLLGFSFIFATILLIKRLPQSVFMRRFSLILTMVFLICSVAFGTMYLSRISRADHLREKMIAINNQLSDTPRVTLTQCDLDLIHQEKTITGKARIVFKNETMNPIEAYLFSLNPGLKIERVVHSASDIPFQRNLHFVSVEPTTPLLPQGMDSLTVYYKGTPDEEAGYLDVPDNTRKKPYRAWLYKIDKRHAFVTPNYVLLSPEMKWYPTTGVGYRSEHPEYHTIDFIQFTLRVTTHKNLAALSQGKVIRHAAGEYMFKPEYPLPQMSLVIGPYEEKSIRVDSVDYGIYTFKKHDYFVPYLNELNDTLNVLVRNLKQDYENQLELSYPYRRLMLVEVPIQFYCYHRNWTVGMETVQPEMVLLPEKGVLLQRADFKLAERMEKRRMERFNQVTTPAESQSRTFSRLIRETLLTEGGMSGFMRGGGSGPGSGGSPLSVFASDITYSIFPNYYTFVNQLRSERWPILNVALESYLKKRTEDSMMQAMRGFFVGLTDQEKANLALMDHTLVEVLGDMDKQDLVPQIIKSKGDYLFSFLQSQIGKEAFQNVLKEALLSSKFRVYDMEELNETLKERFHIDFEPTADAWYNSRTLPGFLLSAIRSYKVLDGNRTRFQVVFTVSNPESSGGLLIVSFRTGGGGPGGGGGRGGGMFGGGASGADVERIIPLSGQQTKEVGFVLDAQPRMMTINTMISRNLPSITTQRFEEFELNNKAAPFDGEQILPFSDQDSQSHEIIVDNEDPGFTAFNPSTESRLKKFLQISSSAGDEKYTGMQFWRPPAKWVATTGSDFYGKMVHSASYTKAGKGERKAIWTAILPESGQYQVYAYIYRIRRMGGRRDQGENRQETNEQYHFSISHDDGIDETLLELKNAENGWNFLGAFYFSADTARVKLTNESPGRIVVADAVKWVKQ